VVVVLLVLVVGVVVVVVVIRYVSICVGDVEQQSAASSLAQNQCNVHTTAPSSHQP